MAAAAPKSILKKTTDKLTETKPTAKTRDERNREIALYHAHLIQNQKDVEAEIMKAIESLIDYPQDADSSSAAPTEKDVDDFTRLVYIFTPSDYDELIEERRIDNKCGYVFCRNAPKTTTGGKLKIVGGVGSNANIMDRKKAESWCSKACAKRALFVKVQLMEEPAWSRRAGSGPDLEILTEDIEQELEGKSGLSFSHDDLEEQMKELAIERGDERKPARSTGMVADNVVERESVEASKAPEVDGDAAGERIEGYLPIRGKKKDIALGDRELNI